MKYFLCLETSSEKGSVGIFKREKGKAFALSYKDWVKSHSERLPLEIQNIVKEAGLSFSDINFLSVGQGPGRFTGVRTGINVVRSLSFSLNIPIFPKDTFKIFAEPFLNQKDISIVCNAFKQSVYFNKISKDGRNLIDPCVLSVADWFRQDSEAFYIGDAWEFYTLPEEFKKQNTFKKIFPSAHDLAQLVTRDFKEEDGVSWKDLQPLYFRSLEHERKI